MTRTLSRRLERLEEQMIPAGEPTILQIVYVDSAGSRKEGPKFEIPSYAPPRTTVGEERPSMKAIRTRIRKLEVGAGIIETEQFRMKASETGPETIHRCLRNRSACV